MVKYGQTLRLNYAKKHSLSASTPMPAFNTEVLESKGSLLPVTKPQVGMERGVAVMVAIARIRELSF